MFTPVNACLHEYFRKSTVCLNYESWPDLVYSARETRTQARSASAGCSRAGGRSLKIAARVVRRSEVHLHRSGGSHNVMTTCVQASTGRPSLALRACVQKRKRRVVPRLRFGLVSDRPASSITPHLRTTASGPTNIGEIPHRSVADSCTFLSSRCVSLPVSCNPLTCHSDVRN